VPVTVDTKGRVRTSKEQRCDILAGFERSGVSAAEFAKQSGIKYSTFAGWLQRHRRAKPKGQPSVMRLLEAVVEQTQGGAASSASSVMVRLAGGTQIEITDAKQIPLAAALVRALVWPC
jgi:lambda repressor-like predicted transcriptional regulator